MGSFIFFVSASLALAGHIGTKDVMPLRDAWHDPNNPIVRIFKGKRLDLWSLRRPAAVTPPKPRGVDWARTPIDRFLLAAMEARALTPSPPADRRTLIRRVTFDLTGLPPTPEQVSQFIKDPSPKAYEHLVDRLLSDRHYGERWARQWMDVVRYADTNGFERDEFRPNTYRYRDYLIRAFNCDKPYDRFVREQLAGDEMVKTLAPASQEDVDRIVATGFLRLGQYDSTGAIFEEDRRGHDQLMADLANTTGSAFLGLTVACANCHDHKYDPISQADHFRLRAFFAGVKFRDDITIDLPEQRAAIERHNAEVEARQMAIEADISSLLAPAKRKIEKERRAALSPEILDLLAIDESRRDKAALAKLKPVLATLTVSDDDAAKALSEPDRKRRDSLLEQIETIKAQRRLPSLALAMTDSGASAPATHIFAQGDYQKPKEEVEPGFLSVLAPGPAAIQACRSGESTGRRTALAEWIASAQNPFTARVMVNRIWQRHFGMGIVRTPNDFGFSGQRPTNQSLLDWLANEFVRSGWSIKRMDRLMVLSAAYRQSSAVTGRGRTIDPDNILLWRQNIRRHDADTLRDSMLAVSGLLLPVTDGPPRWPPVQEDLLEAQPSILETHSDAEARKRLEGWYADPIEKTDVRTIFLIQKRCLPVPFLQPFDLPDSAISCPARTTTTVAPQALTLMNSEQTVRAARAFAARVEREAGTVPARQVDRAVWLALGRGPAPEERRIALGLLADSARRHKSDARASGTPAHTALVDLCRALLNINEFVYVD